MDAKALITHTFTFRNYKDVFRGIIEQNEPIVKAVLTPHAR
jgi:hypothetical protein